MPKKAKELSALEVQRLVRPGVHAVGSVNGLSLQVKDSGARSWLFRYVVGGRRREMGLGSFPTVTLAMARESARAAALMVSQGIDPLEERRAKESAQRAARATMTTFREAAHAYIAAHEAGWRNAKHGAQWRATLETYAFPVMGELLLGDIQVAHVLKALEPIWPSKTETASRLRGRIEKILDWGAARGYRSGENPARWRGHLDAILPKRSKVAKVKHFPALPYAEIAAFMLSLRAQEGLSARALEVAILCACRTSEVIGMQIGEVDLQRAVWVIPGDRMKAGKEHRVPLAPQVVSVLTPLFEACSGRYVFPGRSGTRPISNMSLLMTLRRMGRNDVVTHGFRSSFRDWAAEVTSYPRELAEMALAHTVGDKVEAAYRRGDMFEKRRRMMEDWANWCDRPAGTLAEVVPIRLEG